MFLAGANKKSLEIANRVGVVQESNKKHVFQDNLIKHTMYEENKNTIPIRTEIKNKIRNTEETKNNNT